MREAIGGALLIKLVMFFIVIYICFLAIAINYSITFRVKNQIINLIEAYEGLDSADPYIQSYVNEIGYYRPNIKIKFNDEKCENSLYNGYCVSKKDDGRGEYYKVTTYVTFDFPIIGEIANFPVSGETKVIYNIDLG